MNEEAGRNHTGRWWHLVQHRLLKRPDPEWARELLSLLAPVIGTPEAGRRRG